MVHPVSFSERVRRMYIEIIKYDRTDPSRAPIREVVRREMAFGVYDWAEMFLACLVEIHQWEKEGFDYGQLEISLCGLPMSYVELRDFRQVATVELSGKGRVGQTVSHLNNLLHRRAHQDPDSVFIDESRRPLTHTDLVDATEPYLREMLLRVVQQVHKNHDIDANEPIAIDLQDEFSERITIAEILRAIKARRLHTEFPNKTFRYRTRDGRPTNYVLALRFTAE